MGVEVAAVIGKVVSAVGSLLAAEGIKGAIARFVGLVLLSTTVRKFSGKPRFEEIAGLRLANSSSTIEPRKLIYGTARVGGHVFFFDTSGDNNEFLWYGIDLASHKCAAINTVYLDNNPITAGQIDGSGNVTSGKYAGRVMIKKHLGADDQTVDTDLDAAFGNWTTADRGRGVCYAIVRLKRDDDDNADTPVFPDGAPNSLTFEVDGKEVYDPREGAHDPDDDTTWEFSNNPALCSRDFMVWEQFGYGIPHANIVESKVIASADTCEELVEVQSGVFQERFTCNGEITTDTRLGNTRSALADSMAGKVFESQGLVHIHAGEYDAPSYSLTADDFAGNIELQATSPRKDRYNSTSAVFVDSDNSHQPAVSAPMENATYITDDGEKIPNGIDLPLTDNHFGSQIICLLYNKQSRNQIVFTSDMQPGTIRFGLWDTVSVTFPDFTWTSKIFRVVGWGLNGNGLTRLTFREEDSTAYDSVFGDFIVPAAVPSETFNTDTPLPVSNLVTEGITGGIKIKWDNPPASEYIRIELWVNDTDNFEINGGDPAATLLAAGDFDVFSHITDQPWYYWIRTRGKNAVVNRFPTGDPSTGVLGTPLPASITEIPSFIPGKIGGLADFVFTLNVAAGGGSDDGEVRMVGDTFEHPDGTTVTKDVTDTHVATFYEGTPTGKFYIMFSVADADTRFGGSETDWTNATGDARFCCVTYDSVAGWRARNDSGTYFAFTPLATDCLIAVCEKLSTTGGIDSIIALVAGLSGSDGAPGDIGLPGFSEAFTYDDAQTTTNANNSGEYALLTDRATQTTGSLNNLHNTDGISLCIEDTGVADHDEYYSTLAVGHRIIFYVSASRWWLFEIDELMGTFGSGATKRHIFGVAFITALDPTPATNIDGSDGVNVQFQFNKAVDGVLGAPGFSESFTYDDANTGAANPNSEGEYNLVTDRDDLTTGSLNNLHLTDGISLNIVDTNSVNHDEYYKTLAVGHRIIFYVSASRWWLFEIDELVGTSGGTGATKRHTFGVSFISALDPTPATSIDGADGTNIQFQFNKAIDGIGGASLINSQAWSTPIATPMGPWELYAGDIANTSMHTDLAGPFGEFPKVIRVTGTNPATAPGWFGGYKIFFPVDSTQSYMVAMWIKKLVSDSGNGYLGWLEDLEDADTGNTNSNAYWVSNINTQAVAGKWYLAVGIVHPEGHDTGVGDIGYAGLYDPDDASVVKGGQEYRFVVGQTLLGVRFGMHNTVTNQDQNDGFDFTKPILYPIDGNEPSIETLLNLAAVGGINFSLTLPSIAIPTLGDGTGGDFTDATGEYKVLQGAVDESSNATFSEQSTTGGVTADVNTSVDEFFTGPAGAYRVTAMTNNKGTVTIRAVYAGLTQDLVFNVIKTATPLGMFVSPASYAFSGTNGESPNISGLFTGLASGGKLTYGYLWTFTSGGSGITINTPTVSTTTFTGSGSDQERSGTARCRATDGNSDTADDTCSLVFTFGTPP